MEKILSIIIPSYNMEAYLPQCLDSLLVDNLKDIEVLVVNDGSKDKTLEIAKAYESRFPESIKVIDKPNGNYGSCINSALKIARGKYIRILDADDRYSKSNFEEFVNFLKETDADLVLSSYAITNEKREITSVKNIPLLSGIHQFKDIYKDILDFNIQMHAVIYKRSLFSDLDYHQTEGISYTDTEWIFHPLSKVRTVAFFDKIVYLYLVGRSGQTMDFKDPEKAAKDMFKMASNVLEVYNKIKGKLDEAHSEYFDLFLQRIIVSYYNVFLIRIGNEAVIPIVRNFDENLRHLNSNLYQKMNAATLKSWLPFKHIRYWRNRGNKNTDLLLFSLIRKAIG